MIRFISNFLLFSLLNPNFGVDPVLSHGIVESPPHLSPSPPYSPIEYCKVSSVDFDDATSFTQSLHFASRQHYVAIDTDKLKES